MLLLKDPDAGEDEGTEDPDEDEDEIRDPKALIKSLREANGRLARKLEKRETRIKELEAREGKDEDGVRSAYLQSAFMRAVFEYRDSIDLEAAWDLATLKGYLDGVKIEDDGSVDSEAMNEALGKLVDRYPYLIDDSGEESASDGDAPPVKTRQPRPTQKAKQGVDRAALEKMYPALRRRRRRSG
jgi:hypothetical protein